MRWIHKLVGFICAILLGLWSLLMGLTAIFMASFSQKIAHHIHRFWGKGACWLLGIRLHVTGAENLFRFSAMVLAPNHESIFDLFILATLPIDFKWIAKMQVGRIPIIGWTLRALGGYLVRRDASGADINVMRRVEQGLSHGISVTVFPEGTRTRTGQLLPFKKGAFRIAQNAGVPLIPIAIVGTWAIAPPGKLPEKRGHEVFLRIGEPFAVAAGADIVGVMETFRKELVSLLQADPSTFRR